MHLKYFIEEFPVGGRLFNFLFQCIKLWGIEKFCKGNIQTIAEHFQCEDFWVIAISVEDTFQRRRGNGRNRCQFIDGKVTFLAKLQDAVSGASGDTELFEKASNINGFQGGRVANNLYISPFRATVFKTAALFLHLNSSVVIRVRKPLFFPL